MNEELIYKTAKDYLLFIEVSFAKPIKLGTLKDNKQEVVFTDPLVLDPNIAVVEPGLIRVLVDLNTNIATLIPDM